MILQNQEHFTLFGEDDTLNRYCGALVAPGVQRRAFVGRRTPA
jgi:hypothetical protein